MVRSRMINLVPLKKLRVLKVYVDGNESLLELSGQLEIFWQPWDCRILDEPLVHVDVDSLHEL